MGTVWCQKQTKQNPRRAVLCKACILHGPEAGDRGQSPEVWALCKWTLSIRVTQNTFWGVSAPSQYPALSYITCVESVDGDSALSLEGGQAQARNHIAGIS